MSTPRKIKCVVEAVTDHGDRVYAVDLKPDRSVPVFLPGQFLHLALDPYDPSGFWPESRVFSIASSPANRGQLRIIYSVKGAYTSRMEKELAAGKEVWVKLPYGEFVVDGGTDAVLIAGGTGISAFQAFIEGLPPDHPKRVILLYGARRAGLLLGRGTMEATCRRVANLKVVCFAERDGGAGLPSGEGGAVVLQAQSLPAGSLVEGRISLDVLRECEVSASALYYLAGPPAMLVALRNRLEQQNVSNDRIRVDAWE